MTTPSHPLTASQVKAYQDDGFIVINNVFSSGEIETLRQAESSPEIQTALEEKGIKHKTVHLLELTRRHPAFLALARDPRIVGAICSLLGPDVQLQHSKLATKSVAKGTGEFGWHQDITFYPHSNTSLLSVFVYLDDATPANGCMSMVRGSQRLGPLNHLDSEGHFDGSCREPEHWETNPENVVPITPKAGSISIHHCLTLHGSPANMSGQPRRGVVFSYRADDAQQLADRVFQDTGLVVSGRRHGIVRCESVTWKLPRRTGHDYGTAHFQIGEWANKLNAEAGV